MDKKSKITSLAPALEIERWAEELAHALESFDFEGNAQQANPTFACCLLTQHILSIFSEFILSLEEFTSWAETLEKIQMEYKPLGPPMSPLTNSYFSYWLLYDARSDHKSGTLAEYFLSYASELGIGEFEQESIAAFSSSRMGIYEHVGFEDERICLKELMTDEVTRVICPAGYLGTKGELWFVRVFPALFPEDADVAATTPYILQGSRKSEWIEFFKKNQITAGDPLLREKIHHFMKYGPSITYWHEFIFLAYASSAYSRICLKGIPESS